MEKSIWESHANTSPDSLNIVHQIYPFQIEDSEDDFFGSSGSYCYLGSDILAEDIKISELFSMVNVTIDERDLMLK